MVYGKSTAPIPVSVNRRELIKFLHARGGEHSLLTLCVDDDAAARPAARGTSAAKAIEAERSAGTGGVPASPAGTVPARSAMRELPVLIKQVQHDPVDGEIVHIDFHAIVLTEQIRVKVPIVLTGEPVGVKQDRGVLEHFLREVEVECLPTHIPKQVTGVIEHLKIGDAMHVKDLIPPAGAKIISDPESGVASVVAPKEEKAEEAEAIAEAERLRGVGHIVE